MKSDAQVCVFWGKSTLYECRVFIFSNFLIGTYIQDYYFSEYTKRIEVEIYSFGIKIFHSNFSKSVDKYYKMWIVDQKCLESLATSLVLLSGQQMSNVNPRM